MQRMTYLIDSENVNDAWVKLLPRLERKDRIIIFYTENRDFLQCKEQYIAKIMSVIY